ncbi:MAG: hypothetical protein OYL41_10655 [Acidobacteriota bacterium]|nr:hypothetical protein [Acidobacteriota bacterium]
MTSRRKPIEALDSLVSKATGDSGFRDRLLRSPREAIETEFGARLPDDHAIEVHEDSHHTTHVVLPPPPRLSAAERDAARAGAASLEFLRKTLHDPAPPMRPPAPRRARAHPGATTEAVAEAARAGIRRGLDFLESTIREDGAWHCIRFNVANPDIPRHFERPPFVSAYCALALECSAEPRARAICAATRAYLAHTIEPPGLWRYYRHLPQDLDSTTLCSLVIDAHPWILLGRNVAPILANRDEEGRFLTWVLAADQPDVVAPFRIEADPVVNANVIAYLGDHRETRDAQRWLEALIAGGNVEGASKWYPDKVATYYAASRAMARARPALDRLRPNLADRILELADDDGVFGNVLQAAQAVSALDNVGRLDRIDAKRQVEEFLGAQHEDGSWPELLAFGDQTLKWGAIGQIGHGSEAVTSAFCIEALERLVEVLRA